MAKANKGSNPAKQQPAGAAGATAQAAQVLTLQVKQGVNLRGARYHWYVVLCQYHGQPAAAYLAHCAANPPSLPKSGVAEKPQGWLSWFVRNGIATLA